MGVDTVVVAFMKERAIEKLRSKQGEGKIRVSQTKSALGRAQRYYRSSKECWSMYLLRE